MKTSRLLATLLLVASSVESYSDNRDFENFVTFCYITSPNLQTDIKIVSTFTVKAKVARFVGVIPNQYLKYTNQVTLIIAIYTNNNASVIAVGDKQLGIPLPVRIAVFQDDYTFECSDKKNDVIYCFNTSKLQ